MEGLRPTTRVYVGVLTVSAVSLIAGALVAAGPVDRPEVLIAVAVAGSTALAWRFPIPFGPQTTIYADAAATTAAVLLLPPGLAALAVGLGVLAAHLLHRPSRDSSQAAFNAAQASLAALAGGLLLTASGWDPADPSFDRLWPLLVVPVAAAVMHLLSVRAVATVGALEAEIPVGGAFRRGLLEDPKAELVSQAALVATGALAALVVDASPWWATLFAIPVVAIHALLARQAELRHRAEQARLSSAAGLAEAQRLARLGSWEWSPPADRQVWSDELFRLLGLDPASAVPSYRAFLAAVHSGDRARVDQAIRGARREAAPFELECRLQVPDGSEPVVQLRGEARPDDASGHRFVGTLQDVTERVRAEAAMRRAKHAAEEADRAKSRILSMAAHDLRTPLTSIRGYVELLLMGSAGDLTDDQREFLEIVHGSSARLAALVNDLVDLARIEAGRLELRIQPVHLDDVVAEVFAALGPQAAAKGIRFEAAIDPWLPAVAADPDRLYQVLQNLVGNAVKFTEEGRVTVRARRDGEQIEVAVIDTGIGIEPEALPHVFEEFRQHGEVARRHGGAGLGLTISKRLVELQGGTIAVESRLDRGTTFTLRLPFLPEAVAPDALIVEASRAATAPSNVA